MTDLPEAGRQARLHHARRARRRVLTLAALAAVVAGTTAATAVVATRDRGEASPSDDAPLLVAPPSRAPAPSAARPVRLTPTTAPLPVPEAPPADPYADVPIVQLGTISIPAIGLEDHPIFHGVWLTVIDHGPGHWPGSAMPGQRGNTVFPGHRVTNTRPFYDLDLLVPGDEIVFRTPTGTFTYAVTGTQIVVPTDLWVVDQTETPTVTLIACHPKHSAAQRIVVKGDLVRSEPSAASAAIAERVGGALAPPAF